MARFLNSSISSFTTRMGWGNSESSLDVELVDCVLDGDSFDPPTIGSPVNFEYDSFSFYGITDTYRRDHSTSGFPKYSVQLNNGLHIFGGVELILNDYYGSVNSVPNLLNVFGHLEQTIGFGSSGVNSAGMSWSLIASTVATLVNNISGSTYGGPIKYKGFKFKVDLSNLPSIPSYYRINSDNISLIDFVSDVCEAGGHDFFIRINKPTVGEEAAGWAGTFEVVTVSRISEPTPGKVEEFIESAQCVLSKNYGQEVRKDAHSKFVVGANLERIYFNYPQTGGNNLFSGDGEVTASEYGNDTILPYFGEDVDGNVIIGWTPEDQPTEYYFDIDISDIDTPLDTESYTCSLSELRAAKKGRSSWERFLAERNCNEFLINPTGDYTGYFLLDYGAPGRFYDNIEPYGDLYYIPKYGYMYLVSKVGDYATTVYTTPTSSILSYPHNSGENPYFQRASMLRINTGWEIPFTRMFESDLYTKSLSVPLLATAYREFKDNLGGDFFSDGYLTKRQLQYASRYEDIDLGQFTDSTGNQLFKKIKDLADNYYGKRFMVSIPFTLAAYEPESYNIRMSQEAINEGYLDESVWATAYSAGLIPDISGINTLLTPDYKFYSFVKYEDCVILDSGGSIYSMDYDFSEVSNADKIFGTPHSSGSYSIYDCWVKCNVMDKIVFQDNTTLYGPRAIIETPGAVKNNNRDYPSYAKALLAAYNTYGKQQGGVFYADTGIDNDFIKRQLDKVGGDDAIYHDDDDIVYADLYAVPLRSRLLSYGPWYAVGASGKVVYERNLELNPWNYGGFTAMNNAGYARVTDGITNQTFGENGSVTVPGSPTIMIGEELISGGPYVTDISCNFDSNGTTTTYNFQTWTTHRSLSKLNSYNTDRIQRLSKVSREIRSNFREGLRSGRYKGVGDFYNKLSGRIIDLNEYSRRDRSTTSHRMLSAEVSAASCTVVIQPTYNAGAQIYTDNDSVASMSIDGMFRPFSTSSSIYMPSFTIPVETGLPGTSIDLNPFHRDMDIKYITQGTGIPDWGLNTIQPDNSGEISFSEFPDYRGIGLRLPAIGVGWGYDVDGLPVPADPDNPDEFMDGHRYKMSEWKAGPIDLRWDESRGVWTATGGGGGNRIRFVVEEVYCPDGYDITELYVRVRYTYYDGGCNKTPPGVNDYDGLIDVYDSCVLSYYVAEDLIGREGSATYFYPKTESDYDTCTPRWIVDSICGEPTCA